MKKCIITGNIINDGDPYFGTDKHPISDIGVETIIENWIVGLSWNNCIIPTFIKYLEDRYTKRIKPNRYISLKTKQFILAKYQHKCAFCSATTNLEIDHIKPITKGGLSEIANLQILCRPCNIKKSNTYVKAS